VYGMNLKFPELELLGGWSYPYTVAMMTASALVPMWYFRKRGWLK
jgi:magnesium transporter